MCRVIFHTNCTGIGFCVLTVSQQVHTLPKPLLLVSTVQYVKGRIALAAGGLTTVVDSGYIYADRDPAGGAGAIHFARRDPASTRERLMHSDTIETEQTSALLRVYFYSRLPKCLEKKDISAKREGEEETEKHDAD